MAHKYLTYDYLQKLLQFIIQEHLEMKYGSITRKHHNEARSMYEQAAKALWEPIEIKKVKTRGGQKRDEAERAKIAAYLIKKEGLKPNIAFKRVAQLFPAPNTSNETLVQVIRRNYKRLSDEERESPHPIFSLSSKSAIGNLEELEEDAKRHSDGLLEDVLARIEQKLRKPLS